jgi:alginate O-acetyltransferase complex protein AlgI
MLFTQLVFILFATITLAFLALVRHNRARKLFLLAASYYFYAYWDWRFCGLLLISTIVDFCVGQGLKRVEAGTWRRVLLGASLLCNLGILGFFKYCNFFIETLQSLLAPLGWRVDTLSIILPIGISFYTFQTLSYTFDVYRRKMQPCDDPLDFALFVAFFPQLVAGPIVRAATFLPQLKSLRPLSSERLFLGFRQFTYGLVKKLLLADNLAMVSDFAFSNSAGLDGWAVWLGVLAYAGQIYGDFSGYTDMAIGMARAMGYDFTKNFDHPYLSCSPREFWRRWHISLSTFLRDYLYIPLGGNRRGPVRTGINLMVTMLLGGLWHGAAWTFVFWGALHGAALVFDHVFDIASRVERGGPVGRLLGWLGTMLLVLIGWVFFRSPSISAAFACLAKMFVPTAFAEGIHWISLRALLALSPMAIFHGLAGTRWQRYKDLSPQRWYTPAILFLLVYLALLFRPEDFTPFIYFQF